LFLHIPNTPTEDAKASSAFVTTTDYVGAYGVLNFTNNTLRVLLIAVTPNKSLKMNK